MLVPVRKSLLEIIPAGRFRGSYGCAKVQAAPGLSMAHQRLAALLVALITSFGLFAATPAHAGLPQGNAVKDPAAILRDALPSNRRSATSSTAWKAPATFAQTLECPEPLDQQDPRPAQHPREQHPGVDSITSTWQKDCWRPWARASQPCKLKWTRKQAQFISGRETLARIGDLEALVTEASIPPIPSEFDLLDSTGARLISTAGELTVVDG